MNRPSYTILHLITELDVGGAEQMLYKLVNSLDRERFRSIVISMTYKGLMGEKISGSGIPVYELGMRPGRPDLRAIPLLINLLKSESVDILQTWLYHSDLLGLMAGKIARVPKIVWGIRCSEMKFKYYSPLTYLTMRICALLSALPDAIILNSHAGKDVHRDMGYKAWRMKVIPNGFNTSVFQPDLSAKKSLKIELGLSEPGTLIGMVARFDPMKDHRTFLKAASILAAQTQNVHFVLVGKGMEPANTELTSEIQSNLKGRLHLLGQRDDMPKVMAGLDILTNLSFGEGFSNVIGEAMSSGTVCVASDVGDSAYIMGDTGLLVKPGDHSDLILAWKRMLELGENGRRELGEKSRERIIRHFSMERIAKLFGDFYIGLFRKKPGSIAA